METQLSNLGYRFLCLKATQTQDERAKVLERFNDPSSDIMILLMTTSLGSVSLNLQGAASRIIVMEIPVSFYVLVQVLGRIYRIGQRQEQFLYLLYTEDTYDQIAIHKMFVKIVPSLAGEGNKLAEGNTATQDAEFKLCQFLGIEHSAYAPEWGVLPYSVKDKEIAEKKASQQLRANAMRDGTFQPEVTPRKDTSKYIHQQGKRMPVQRTRLLSKLSF